MFQTPKESCSVLTVFSNSFKLYKDVFVKVLPWTICVALLKCIGLSHTSNGMDDSFHLPILSIVMSCLSALFYGCIIYQIWQTIENKQSALANVFSKGFTRGLIGLISYAIYTALVALALFACFWLLHYIPVIGEIVWGGIAIVVGIYLSVSLISWLPSIVNGENPFSAFKQAFKIIKGSWWSTFALFVLVLIVTYVLFLVVGFIFGQNISDEMTQLAQATPKEYIATALLAIVFTPWLWSVFVLQTVNLKLKQQS